MFRTVCLIYLAALWIVPSPILANEEASKPLPKLEELALKLLDCEALYTVSGGLKPVSEGFVRSKLPLDEPESERIVSEMRSLLAQLPLGPNVDTGVLVFTSKELDYRSAAGFIAHRPALRRKIREHQELFGRIGVSEIDSAQSVMDAINGAHGSDRWKAFGLVFGYPEDAVDFFVQAGEEEKATGKFVERDFFQIPTQESDRGRFVFAVAKGESPKAEHLLLKSQAVEILERYRIVRRSQHECQGYNGLYLLQCWVDLNAASSSGERGGNLSAEATGFANLVETRGAAFRETLRFSRRARCFAR